MIISASRRTDIPTHHAEWFLNRLRAGFVLVPNPFNIRQISRVRLTPDAVDGLVFWTKNPRPLLARLDELKDYTYYFQFTLTPYGKEIEPHAPVLAERIADFQSLSRAIGPDRVIWRYDPIILNARYSPPYHIRSFEEIAAQLQGYTRQATISFIDERFRGARRHIRELALSARSESAQRELGASLAEIARRHALAIETCAEKIDLKRFGVERARCVDDRLFAKLGRPMKIGKDKNQRLECGCVASIDVGMYNTCRTGCLYCYANYGRLRGAGDGARYDPRAPLLYGEVGADDKISEREVKPLKAAPPPLGDF